MKRLLVALIPLLFLAACGNENTSSSEKNAEKETVIYTTVYPITYFTQQIVKDTASVQSIYPNGANEHTFEPKQKDMMQLADADLFLYVGLGLEGFVENAQKTLSSQQVEFIPLSKKMDDSLFLHLEEEPHDHEDHDHGEIDPHIWLSPKVSMDLAKSIHATLVEKFPENEEEYTKNFHQLETKLASLDADYSSLTTNAQTNVFFVSHAAFSYIARDYGLEQVAVAGINSQSEPSQKELTELVKLAEEKNIQTIFFEQNVSSNLTKVIQKEVGASASTLHNLSVLTEEDVKNNEDYFTLMEQNRQHLKKALSQRDAE
ncbi:metal ABC transporter solute-binding protein, Zn/Mn family [Paenisporosarcina cavernae]|uniref:Adhesin n=1 Tax=Paenisporosarcina cavernae TaxID=2320858 RepID=A0A385YSY8_9BACL|nr:zinc ABC transporter substrate-binding protein [Paenisporosarcina cavernae]AYC29919.1 adhesin [Paenisporosarcina cavernae]